MLWRAKEEQKRAYVIIRGTPKSHTESERPHELIVEALLCHCHRDG